MAKKKQSNHIHKYVKKIIGKDYVVYACADSNCTHYTTPKLTIGKLSICNRCGNTFAITADMVMAGREMAKPHCRNCTKGRRKVEPQIERKLDNFLANFGIKPVDE